MGNFWMGMAPRCRTSKNYGLIDGIYGILGTGVLLHPIEGKCYARRGGRHWTGVG